MYGHSAAVRKSRNAQGELEKGTASFLGKKEGGSVAQKPATPFKGKEGASLLTLRAQRRKQKKKKLREKKSRQYIVKATRLYALEKRGAKKGVGLSWNGGG